MDVSTETPGWKNIDTAPQDCSEFEGIDKNGDIHIVHYACDMSGSEQPPFKGFFKNHGTFNSEVNILLWRPINSK